LQSTPALSWHFGVVDAGVEVVVGTVDTVVCDVCVVIVVGGVDIAVTVVEEQYPQNVRQPVAVELLLHTCQKVSKS